MTAQMKTEASQIFYALSDDIRLKIVRLLSEGELCVCDLMAALQMGQSRISFHMGVLKTAGLITSRRFGRWNSYKIVARKKAQAAVVELVRNDREISVTEEKKRLRAYLKRKNQLGPDGSKCCPDMIVMEKSKAAVNP